MFDDMGRKGIERDKVGDFFILLNDIGIYDIRNRHEIVFYLLFS